MKTLIAIIAYNEELNIRTAIEDLRDHNTGFDVVVVDNGSADGTVAYVVHWGFPSLLIV
jgi:glycosyltransferase involved in cell wall biosynthesis